MIPLENMISIASIVLPILGAILITALQIGKWFGRITTQLDAIHERLASGQSKMDDLESGLKNHEHRITVLETVGRKSYVQTPKGAQEHA